MATSAPLVDICVWIDRSIGISVHHRIPCNSTVAALKKLLAADDILGQICVADLVLSRPGRGADGELRDTSRLTAELAELELTTRSLSAEAEANTSYQVLVGAWLYNGKYRYRIRETKQGGLEYSENLSDGCWVKGQLIPHDEWYLVELLDSDGGGRGTMRLRVLDKCGGVLSNLMSSKTQEWGKDMVAYKIVLDGPMRSLCRDVEWFEVVFQTILIKQTPDPNGLSWGLISIGRHIQVSQARALDEQGREWVELTHCELWRSCEDARENTSARGFALIDGMSLGLPQLLRGPLQQGEQLSSAKSGSAFIPAMPYRFEALVHSFEQHGYVHIPELGVQSAVLGSVSREAVRLEEEMSAGQRLGTEFQYRTDSRLFFDTSVERKRSDIPGLNQLVSILTSFMDIFSYELSHSPLQLHLDGCCRPMIACYQPDGHYQHHVDNTLNDGRVLTLVYYLNPDWTDKEAGELRLYPDADRRLVGRATEGERTVDILPTLDSLAIFRADWMVHEVLRATRKRFALTIWFNGRQGST